MKKQAIFLFILFSLLSGNLLSQHSDPSDDLLTPGGMFDVLYDNDGNQYQLVNLSLNALRPISGNNSINSSPNNSCSAGYFNIYFAANSVFDGAGSIPTNMRNIVCQVFTDLTGLISSPLSPLANTGPKVNIFCGNTTNTTITGPPGEASPFYCFPAMPTNTNQGIADNQIFKMISSGSNPYSSLPIGTFYNGGNFYHGFLNANPSYSTSFNLNTGILNIASTDYDFYTIVLHEAMHALGFITLISSTGLSQFGQFNNYYSRYDTYLTDSGGTPLLAASVGSCSASSLTYQASSSAIQPGTCPSTVVSCGSAAKYVSSNVNVKVFTPDCYFPGSSLSHFNDVCSTPATFTPAASCTAVSTPTGSGLYFLMSYAVGSGSCFVKRYPKSEERFVLCDIGYSVGTTYSSTALLSGASNTTISYGGSACPGLNIWGVNDGIVNGVYTLTTTTGSTVIPVTTFITNNDAASTSTISCLEVVYNNATYTLGATNLSVSATAGSGLVVIKYYPVDSGGTFGNATYIFVYFVPPSCNPPSVCNMVQNGGFENLANGLSCGLYVGPNAVPNASMSQLSCWDNYQPDPDLYTRSCTTGTFYNLGSNTQSTNPPIDSYNGTPNDRVVGIVRTPVGGGFTEVLKNNLSSPLIPGNTYQVSLLVKNYTGFFTNANITNTSINPNAAPIVISLASYSTFAFVAPGPFPAGLTPLVEFTVSANTSSVWTALTSTFTCPSTPTTQQYALIIGMDPIKTDLLTGTATAYCFIDEVFISPIPSETFSIPTATVCGFSTYTNLAQYASTTGTFSGQGVTYSAGQYNFNAPSTGTFPVAFTYSANGCLTTLWQNIVSQPAFTVSVSASNTVCANSPSTMSLTASFQPVGPTLLWQPGNLSGSVQVVTPTASVVYTLTAIHPNQCVATATLSTPVYTNCCTSTVTPYTATSSVGSATITGPISFVNGFSVLGGQTIKLENVVEMPPNTSIRIKSGGELILTDIHLYSCGTAMWQGIIVENGGKISSFKEFSDNLIEDAITGIDITGHSSSSVTQILNITNTTFNKNFVGINIASYQNTLAPSAFYLSRCVFSCRTLQFNSTTWPQVGATSTATDATADLRTAINSTTGLLSPFLAQNGMTIITLKSPYTNQTSKYAIQLSDVGLTSGSTFHGIQIGDPSSSTDFNLFDAHEIFIYGTNSNIKSYNNVFQNTKHSLMSLPGFVAKGTVAAIVSNITTNLNANLDLTSTDFNKGNRFWNCHKAIMGNNVYRFNIEKGIFRSTQSTSPASGLDVGRVGIQLNTNRMQYFMRYNEFSNIGNCINVPIVAGSFTSMATGSVQYGVYAANVAVLFNTISIGSGTNNFVNNAVNVSAVNAIPWTIAPDYTTSTLNSIGIKIENNSISDARRGIYVENVTGFVTEITENSVALVPDNLFSTSQHGVHLTNFTAGFNKWQHSVIGSNTLSAQSVTNSLSTLVFCGNNPGGPFSPSVSCNDLSNAYHGFNFTGWNLGTFWRGNKIDPMPKGLVISTGGINTQGSSGNPVENEWRNASSWTSNTYTQTYVENAFALNSILWVESGATTFPTSNSGSGVIPTNWYVPGSSIFTTTGSYDCGDVSDPTDFVLSVPEAENFDSDGLLFNAQNSLYRYLHFNDSLRVGGTALGDFYDDMAVSTMGSLLQTEEELYEGNYGTARTILSGLTPTNSIEENCISFYSLYANYQEDLETEAYYSTTDSTQLFELANLCPEIDGHIVYQARALYFVIYGLNWQYSDCSETGSRVGISISNSTTETSQYALSIFPNPAQFEIYIFSNRTIKNASLLIHDLSGRSFYESTALSLEQEKSKINVNLINGAYILTIIDNKTKESHVFKLFIAN